MAIEATTLRVAKGLAEYVGEGPKWRLEHASSGQATCQQAACKRGSIKIAKGELRLGTHTLFEQEGRWYMAWRHWGCATKFQILGLKMVTDNDVTKAPGYERLNPDAQEQVRLAFENDGVVDKEFKGLDGELAKVAKRYGGDIINATGYKVDIATRGTASCRKSDCPWGTSKIAKGEMRLGISVPFDGEHESWQYKHWMCMSKYDIEAIQQRHNEDTFDGLQQLPEDHQAVAIETLEKGEAIEPPKQPPPAVKQKKSKKKVEEDSEADAPKPKRKTRARSKKNDEDTDDAGLDNTTNAVVDGGAVADGEQNEVRASGLDEGAIEGAVEAKPTAKPKTKARIRAKAKGKGKKRSSEEFESDSEEPEYVPRKTRSRAIPMEVVVDAAVARI